MFDDEFEVDMSVHFMPIEIEVYLNGYPPIHVLLACLFENQNDELNIYTR